VAGEPGGSVPAVRSRIREAWGAELLDHAGATEVGPWGVGDLAGHGLDVIEPWFHAEFLAVKTGKVAAMCAYSASLKSRGALKAWPYKVGGAAAAAAAAAAMKGSRGAGILTWLTGGAGSSTGTVR
jgi:hypothetical protein